MENLVTPDAMSGHSKWAQIKRQKGVADAKRGTLLYQDCKHHQRSGARRR